MSATHPAQDLPGLSACIISMNEEDRIGDCLDSLDFCDEWVVVDSHSSDRTREVAREFGARVIERDWPGHVAQKEFAIRAASNDWVLCLDADERISPALREELLNLRRAGFPGHPGWRFPRLSNYLGTWVRYGTWYPDLQLRLFDRRRGHWGGHDPHDRVELEEAPGRLGGDLLHYPYRDLAEHLATIEKYTTTMAEGLHARGKRARPWNRFLNPAVRFFRFYVLKRGFLLGPTGWRLAVLAARYVKLKYTKLEALGQLDRPTPQELRERL